MFLAQRGERCQGVRRGGGRESLLEKEGQEWKAGKSFNRCREVSRHYRREKPNGQKPGGEL